MHQHHDLDLIVLALAKGPVEKLFFTRETCLTLDMGCKQIRKTWVDITKICTDFCSRHFQNGHHPCWAKK